MGKDTTDEALRSKGIVPLGIFGEGRLGLPPGRKGEVIAVHEEELATAIAYSLASQEYYDQLQNVLRDDQDGVDFDFSNDMPTTKGEDDTVNARKLNSAKRINDDNTDSPRSANRIDGEEESTGTRIIDTLNANISSIFSSLSGSNSKQGDSQQTDKDERTHSTPNAKTSNLTDVQYIQNLRSKMMSQKKSHIRHRFEDKDWKGKSICKFMCESHWAVQFEAVRTAFLKDESNEGFIRSLAMSSKWIAQGGKSGATFSKSLDGRFIVKVISRVELQMFLEFAPAYFGNFTLSHSTHPFILIIITEYMSNSLFDNRPTILCKILGVYTIGCHNKETNKKTFENVIVMENIFYEVSYYFQYNVTMKNL
jgi:1-phosphatidylinositol-3-phosphate 5-kinase